MKHLYPVQTAHCTEASACGSRAAHLFVLDICQESCQQGFISRLVRRNHGLMLASERHCLLSLLEALLNMAWSLYWLLCIWQAGFPLQVTLHGLCSFC